MEGTRRLWFAVALIAALVGAGTAGYMLIENMPLEDAVYMTVITITTVGYGEVKPLGSAGRIFTMLLIFTGVGTAYYVLAAVTEMVVGGQLRELVGRSAMSRKIHQLEGHVIICGYGRFGSVVAGELRRHGTTRVIIENDPAKENELIRVGELYVLGSALDEATLDMAEISRARDIVIATASDPDNVYIALSARSKNPRMRIHARAESEIGLKHLELAGVDQAISSYQWSAMRIANAIARPSVVDFLNLLLPGAQSENFSLEELRVPPGSHLVGSTILGLEKEYRRVRFVALKRNDEPISLIPGPDTELRPGDLFVVIGGQPDLRNLTEEFEK